TVSIDDFGTGFSSLNMLKDVSVDIIKFDRSLLTDSAYKDKVTAVISNLVRMAKDLGIMTVSEGIETSEQAEYLSSICCNTAQGYYFDKPLPPEGFMQKLKNRSYLDKKK
ncbi:MAG: EAL domain-containing protein, partial [Oscillospiraceae bacterium]|nr:EAL domain-containing protein [Oscillospiraceae bacterium]